MEQNTCNALLGKKKVEGLSSSCNIYVFSRRHRLADVDGISAKAVLDGIVRRGLLPDDTTKEVKGIFFTQEKIGKHEEEETIITIKKT